VRERGFTLIELLVVAAIVITVAAFALSLSNGLHPMAMRSALSQFDAALAYGKAIASTSGNGATLLVTARQSGFEISIYSGRPTAAGALKPAGIAPLLADGTMHEISVGPPPFAIFLDGAGHAALAPFSGATPAPMPAQPSCPASRDWTLEFTSGNQAVSTLRSLPCAPP
jgi:prepilin-type N-terminal cleavage/methylation domain-containing protein